MKLSVVILTMSEKDRLLTCLESLRTQRLNEPAEIIVVDNGSDDGTAELLRDRFPEVRLIRNQTNRGISRARNQGIARAQGEYVLFLDNDTTIGPDALVKIIAYMDAHQDVGIVGAKLENPDGSVQFSCRRFPTMWIPLASRIPPLRRLRFMRQEHERHLMTDFDHEHEAEVDYVLGACQFLRRKAIDSIGPYDERIFFGPEDCDYAMRCWQAGWRVVYFPAACMVHDHRRRTRHFGRLMLKHIKGMIWFFWKHRYLVRPPVHPRLEERVSP